MNKTKEFAAMFGLELGERFTLKGKQEDGYYYFDENGLIWMSSNGVNGRICTETLIYILNGKYEPVPLPWKPKDGGIFYTHGAIENLCYAWTFNIDNSEHLARYAMGNCFRSMEEAEKHRDEIMAKFAEIRKELEDV